MNAVEAMQACVKDRGLSCRPAKWSKGGYRVAIVDLEGYAGIIVSWAEWYAEDDWHPCIATARMDRLVGEDGAVVAWVTLPVSDVEAGR